MTVAHHTFADSHGFERRLAEHVRRWLDAEIKVPHYEGFRPFWRGESPFRGLQSFEAEHQAIYFGRSEAMSDLMRRIHETEAAAATEHVPRMLLVQGMSGAGKTSLFKAGLVPILALRPVEGIGEWIAVEVRPSESDPSMRHLGALGVLASRLSERIPAIARLGTGVAELAEALFERPEEAAARIEDGVRADAERAGIDSRLIRLLIYVDQLEEAATNPDSSARDTPLIAAMTALAHSGSIWVAATVRSDFAHRFEAYPDFMQALGHGGPYTLLPPRPDELAEMIREPARAAGLIWEERGGVSLDQELLRDATANPESLPLLEYTLAELYERRAGRELRWSEYGGGLKRALISAADEVVGGTTGDIETAFRDVMRELVGVGEDGAATRRYASLARFPAGSPARMLLDRLVERRLCVTTDQRRGDGPVTSLAHEALIRSWPRAQEWLQRETSLLRIRDELARDAAVWDYHERSDDWLAVAPEKLAGIRKIEREGLMPAGAAADYAMLSRRRGRRNRRIRRMALMGICTLAIAAAIAWWVALRQRDVARTEAATSERTTGFMVSLFQLADPTENRGNAVTVKEVLDKGAKEIRSESDGNSLKREPRVRAELLTAMGQAYSGLGLYTPAEDLFDQARADQNGAAVPDESRVRTLVASGATLHLAGKYDDAAKTLRSAVELARRSLKPANVLRTAALTGLADVLVQLENYDEAIQLCQEALVADRKRGPQDAAVLANTLASLGYAYVYSGDLAAAEKSVREALGVREQIFGTHHALTAQSLNDLGVVLYQMGRYDEATLAWKQALPIEREVYGPEHPEVATITNNIGRSTLVAGHIDEAEPLLRQSLAMFQKFQGESYDGLVPPLNSLAMIDAYRGHFDAARNEIQRAESIARLPDHGELLDQVLLNEADFEMARGDRGRAAALLIESKALLQRTYPAGPDTSWRYAVWDSVNAELLAANGDPATAAAVLAAAQKVLTRRFGAASFYCVLAERRAQSIAGARKL